MIRRILSLLLLLSLVVSANAFAGGSGNCVEPIKLTSSTDGWRIGAAFEYNYVARRLRDLTSSSTTVGSVKVRNMNQIYGKILLGLNDIVNLYAKIGSCGYDISFRNKARDEKIKVETEPGIFTGMGINALFPLMEICDIPISIGGDIQGNIFVNNAKKIKRNGTKMNGVDGDLYGLDGKNSIYVSAKYDIESMKMSVVPYVGGYQSWILIGSLHSLVYDTGGTNYRKSIDTNYDLLGFGVMLGLDLEIAKFLVFNVEGRFIGEEAITTGATLKF